MKKLPRWFDVFVFGRLELAARTLAPRPRELPAALGEPGAATVTVARALTALRGVSASQRAAGETYFLDVTARDGALSVCGLLSPELMVQWGELLARLGVTAEAGALTWHVIQGKKSITALRFAAHALVELRGDELRAVAESPEQAAALERHHAWAAELGVPLIRT